MSITWQDLFLQTLREPEASAKDILAIALQRSELWLAVVAAAAMNAVITGLSVTLVPPPPGWPAFMTNPFVYFVMVAGGLVLFSHLLTWVGRAMGGEGTLDGILKLIVWLQFVRIVLASIGLVLMLAAPFLATIYGLITAVLTLWILITFIKAGHGLPSIGGAVLVLFVTLVGLVIGLALLLTLIGPGAIGVQPNV